MLTNLVLGAFGGPSPSIGLDATDIRLQEADHRIANSLSLVAGLIQLHASEIDTGEPLDPGRVIEILHEAAGRVHMVSRLHRLLARSHGQDVLDLSPFLHEIAESTVTLMTPPGRVRIEMDGSSLCEAPAAKALPIGLIVSELVTNSIKYAHPAGVGGVIRLVCHRGDNGGLTVEVSDDGVGLPETFDPATARSLGMRLIHSLSSQAGGTVRFDDNGVGLAVRLTVPAGL
jgi:two-component sensor histidine kinase